MTDLERFLTDQLPTGWFAGPPAIEADGDEVLCVGRPSGSSSVEEFRESTRAERIAIAEKVEARFGRTVSWGATSNGVTTMFTTLSVPAMTRLRFRERAVLDTLVEAGVARSRSDALAWCVRLVARHESEWLAELREALVSVAHVRAEGPTPI